MARLEVRSLNQTLGKRQILDSVSFHVDEGKIVAFLGPNGAGKTTLLRTVIGLLPAPRPEGDQNAIIFNGQCINGWSVAQRVAAGLQYLPQQGSLFSDLSLEANLQLIAEYHPHWLAIDRAARADRFQKELDRWLEKMHLQAVRGNRAGQLSGGQQRKAEVIRALLMHPQVVMLDEPFAGVDPKSIYELKHIFQHLAKQGVSVVISDHHVDQLFSIADTIYVVLGGKVVASGGVEEIMQDETTKNMYLGGQFFLEMSKRFLSS